ncbi:hypothetical protein [Klebsiella huaxiensis]|uniref:DUF1627 domain-containing protein n=2 Tax=Klebsiella huaxiensis TaxID=2153354 RepID=A0A564KU04_9ENTR|nr:hypothetical protein [Klebsiella huaxiensis]VUS72842.1 hypothetical protein SB6422_05798 [Klebsiella huaxiensis]
MENLTDILKAMGKATTREIAARMKIEPIEALNLLRELEELEKVASTNGYWNLVIPFTPEVKPKAAATPKPVLRAKNITKPKAPRRPERLDPDAEFEKVSELLRKNDRMTAADIGKALSRDSRGMISTLRVLEKQGRIVKNGTGKGVTWSLLEGTEWPAQPVESKPTQAQEFINTIPVLIKPQNETVIPTLAQVAKEIRQAKTKLNRLQKLRETIRELGKHKKFIQQVMGA